MFGGNITIIELRLSSEPEASQRADVVNAGGFMTQGKKEDDKKPMFFKVAAWKYAGKVLMGMQKNKLYFAVGRWSMEWWGDEKEKSGLVFTAEDFGEKLFAPQQDNGQNQGGYQQSNQNQQNGGNQGNQQNQQSQGFQGGQQNDNQGSGFQGNQQQQSQGYQHDNPTYGGNSGGGPGGGPPDDDIPFSCNIA